MKENKNIFRISNILNLTRQEFSVLEKQLFVLTLFEIKHLQGVNINISDRNSSLEVTIKVTDLKETNRTRIKESLEKITSRKIYFEKGSGRDFTFIVPFSYASYQIQEQSAYIILHVNGMCKHLFLELANGYTQADLNAILSLKSKYSIRMYELLSQYSKMINWTIEIDALQNLLGVDAKAYKNYTDFERQILKYSQKELYEHCSLYFEWKTARKEGKKIVALTFTIIHKEKLAKKEMDYEIQNTQDYISQLTPIEIQTIFNKVVVTYQLSENQKDKILNDKKLLNEFIRVDIIIQDKLKKGTKIDITRYMAKSLKL